MTSSAGKLHILLSFGDIAERIVLGKSLITEDWRSKKLSNNFALEALLPAGADRSGLSADRLCGHSGGTLSGRDGCGGACDLCVGSL